MSGNEIEAEWERSLAAADDAVEEIRRAETLPPDELAAETGRLREERRWFSGIRGTLSRIVPRRD